ncbi:MAG: SRPBCC family protein [Dehalococcoidia bacterium]
MGVIKLTPQSLFVKAHRDMLYQMVSAIGRGRLPGPSTMSSKLVSKEGNTLVAEFYTKVGRKTVTTLEEVTLYPSERISYRWLRGPVKYVYEEFLFREADGGVELAHWGEFDLKIPIFGWFIGRFYVKPRFERVVLEHMEELKQAAEARAARSHVFKVPG